MMRKDVKLGFAIGGVLLAVLVVYVLVGTGSSSNDHPTGAGIVTEDTSGKTGTPKVADRSSPKGGGVSHPAPIGNDNNANLTAGNSPSSSTPTTGGPTTAPANPEIANANPTDPSKPRDANNDLWDTALNSGQLLISKTPEVPGGGEHDANATGDTGGAGPSRASLANGTSDIKGTASNAGTLDSRTNGTTPEPSSNRFSSIDRIGGGIGSTPSTQPSSNENSLGSGGSLTSSSQSSAGHREHVVQRNETLSSISQAAYGSPNYYPAILRANPNLDPKRMKPGMTITLPPMNEVKPDVQSPVATIAGNGSSNSSDGGATAAFDSKTEYRVQSNDSLYRIAMKLYGKPDMIAKLYDANKDTIGPDPAKLKLNMVLKLPEPPTQSASR